MAINTTLRKFHSNNNNNNNNNNKVTLRPCELYELYELGGKNCLLTYVVANQPGIIPVHECHIAVGIEAAPLDAHITIIHHTFSIVRYFFANPVHLRNGCNAIKELRHHFRTLSARQRLVHRLNRSLPRGKHLEVLFVCDVVGISVELGRRQDEAEEKQEQNHLLGRRRATLYEGRPRDLHCVDL